MTLDRYRFLFLYSEFGVDLNRDTVTDVIDL